MDIIHSGNCPHPIGNGTGTAESIPFPTMRLQAGLAQVHRVNTADRQVEVGCGITLATLESELTAVGLYFPAKVFDPTRVSLGGWLGSGMPGSGRRILPSRRLLAATMLTPQGRLIHSGANTPKDVAGYDFHRPIVGARGRLGMLLEVTLAVDTQPDQVQFLCLTTDNPVLWFDRIDMCKTVERLWVTSNDEQKLVILIEQRGNPSALVEDSKLLVAKTEHSELLTDDAPLCWNRLLSNAFSSEGYYLCWALPAAQAYIELAKGGWWGNPWECKIWRYLGIDKSSADLLQSQTKFERKGERLFPYNVTKQSVANSYTKIV